MGGHAATVWPAYGVTVLILAGLLAWSLRTLRRRRAELELLKAGRERPHR